MFWVGLVLVVASGALGVFGGLRAADAIGTAVQDAAPMPGGNSTVQLAQGDERTIYEESQTGLSVAECSVLGPSGQPVTLSRDTDLTGSLGDVSYVNVGSFEGTEAGLYEVTCSGAATLIGPSLDVEAVGTGALGVVGGLLGAGLGAILVIAGAILWFLGRSRSTAAGTPSDSGSPPPPPGSYGGSVPPSPGSYGGQPADRGPSGGLPPPSATGGSHPPPPPPQNS